MFDIHAHNGITLAYIGDAVIELFIREALIASGVTNTGRLSAAAQKLVCAPMQSALTEKLLPLLSEEEDAVYKLGRNHHVHAKPKHATVAEYSRATGMEAVFGYLHLVNNHDRAKFLFTEIYREPLSEITANI